MHKLCSYLGGSISYGLATPESDKDERFVFLNTEIKDIIGLSRHEEQVTQNKTEDSVGYELRRFFQLLKKTNTTSLEILHNEEWTFLDDKFKRLVLDNKKYFMDTEYTFKSICGYVHGERNLVLGLRTGQLGSKRKNALDIYGFSPKNLVNFMRLCFCGMTFFSKGYFPVNVEKEDKQLRDLLFEIKIRPESLKKEEAAALMDQFEDLMKLAFDNRDKSKDYHFNEKRANEIILDFYLPYLEIDYYDRANLN